MRCQTRARRWLYDLQRLQHTPGVPGLCRSISGLRFVSPVIPDSSPPVTTARLKWASQVHYQTTHRGISWRTDHSNRDPKVCIWCLCEKGGARPTRREEHKDELSPGSKPCYHKFSDRPQFQLARSANSRYSVARLTLRICAAMTLFSLVLMCTSR